MKISKAMLNVVRRFARIAGVDLISYRPDRVNRVKLDKMRAVVTGIGKLNNVNLKSYNEFLLFCEEHIQESSSQFLQDLVVLFYTQKKTKGYFVEFGACDGVGGSNTYLLERKYNWLGLLSEPNPFWHKDLKKNRFCDIDFNCIWNQTGEKLEFLCVDSLPGLSTLQNSMPDDNYVKERDNAKKIIVETVSLEHILLQKNSPRYIDYLSVDTEGSEYNILRDFNFSKYRFGIITVEHNHTSNREKLHQLFTDAGYIRVLDALSDIDSWYVDSNILDSSQLTNTQS